MKKSELKKIIIEEIKSIIKEDAPDISSLEMDVLKAKINKEIGEEGFVGINSQGVVQYLLSDNPRYALYVGAKNGSYFAVIADLSLQKAITKPKTFGTFQSTIPYAVKLVKQYKEKMKK